jgi:hypothetical protein
VETIDESDWMGRDKLMKIFLEVAKDSVCRWSRAVVVVVVVVVMVMVGCRTVVALGDSID